MGRVIAISVICVAVFGIVIQQLVAAPPEEPILANTAAVTLANPSVVTILENAGEWRIELGTGGAGAGCQVFGSDPDPGAPFVFRNLSNQSVMVQGTPVPGGGTLNLGKSWPTPSNPTGSLQITRGGTTQTAYLTVGFVDGVECWGAVNMSLTP